MPPLEWLTPTRVMRAWGLAATVGMFAAGIINVYLAAVWQHGYTLLGVDAFLLAGAFQFLAGVSMLLYANWVAVPAPGEPGE